MNLDFDKMRADGFFDDEIAAIRSYCEGAETSGTFSTRAELLVLNGEPMWVCRTIAEIVEELRPGTWLSRGLETDNDDAFDQTADDIEQAADAILAEATYDSVNALVNDPTCDSGREDLFTRACMVYLDEEERRGHILQQPNRYLSDVGSNTVVLRNINGELARLSVNRFGQLNLVEGC